MGTDFLVKHAGAPWLADTPIHGLAAAAADSGVAQACVSCHNEHKDTPRTDFELDDVMGGVVIRVPVDG